MKSLFERNVEKFQELIPEARWAAECWHNDCVALGRPFTVSEVFRTVERQQALYAQGRTKPGPIVTERDGVKILSEHQLRTAADIYPNFTPPISETPGIKPNDTPAQVKAKQLAFAYKLIDDVAIKYGIDHPYTKGRFIDLPHFTFQNTKQKPQTPVLPKLSPDAEKERFARGIQRMKGKQKENAAKRFQKRYGMHWSDAIHGISR